MNSNLAIPSFKKCPPKTPHHGFHKPEWLFHTKKEHVSLHKQTLGISPCLQQVHLYRQCWKYTGNMPKLPSFIKIACAQLGTPLLNVTELHRNNLCKRTCSRNSRVWKASSFGQTTSQYTQRILHWPSTPRHKQTRAHVCAAQAHLPHEAHANPTKQRFEILSGFSPTETLLK